MGERNGIWRVVMWVVLISIVIAGTVHAQEEEATVAGMLVGIYEDENGNFTRVYLQDDNLGAILIVDDENGKKLLELVGTQIEATGILEDLEGEDFAMQLHVKVYRSIG